MTISIQEFHRLFPVHHVVPDTCWCGAAAGRADDHLCGECAAHCELQAHREGRPSPRDVALRAQRGAVPAAAEGRRSV